MANIILKRSSRMTNLCVRMNLSLEMNEIYLSFTRYRVEAN